MGEANAGANEKYHAGVIEFGDRSVGDFLDIDTTEGISLTDSGGGGIAITDSQGDGGIDINDAGTGDGGITIRTAGGGSGGISIIDHGDGGLTLQSSSGFVSVSAGTALGMAGATASLIATTGNASVVATHAGAKVILSDLGGTSDGIQVGNSAASKVGLYGTAPIAKQTGVAVTAAAIHAALVALGVFSA